MADNVIHKDCPHWSDELTNENIRIYRQVAVDLMSVQTYSLGEVAAITGFDSSYIATTFIKRKQVIRPKRDKGSYEFNEEHIRKLKVIKWLKDEMFFELGDAITLTKDLEVLEEVAHHVTECLSEYSNDPSQENYVKLIEAYADIPGLSDAQRVVMKANANGMTLSQCAERAGLGDEGEAKSALKSGFAQASRIAPSLPLLRSSGLLDRVKEIV